jgi:ATP/maltotriose-dependent transcriptional regulator MalT
MAARAGVSQRPQLVRGTAAELSKREAEVLELVRAGLSNEQIAKTLWISATTVKVHLRHIFEKLGVRSRTEAALAADSTPPKERE